MLTADMIRQKTEEVQKLLDPLLAATQTRQVDPLTGRITVNGTGYDRLLDSLRITITPASDLSSNIEVALKIRLADGQSAPVVQFTSDTPLAQVGTVATASSTDLVPSGTTAQISDLLKRATACYALPLSTRVTPDGRVAGDVVASECRDLFVGKDPGRFLDQGRLVAAGQAFPGLFGEGATGTQFLQGTYEITRDNGDILVAYKTRSRDGDDRYATFFARVDSDGRLRFIGDQFAYSGYIIPYQQLRSFFRPASGPLDFYATGYFIGIDNVTGGAGLGGSIYQRVVVQSPFGRSFELVPAIGQNRLEFKEKPGTQNLRLRAESVDRADPTDPCRVDISMLCLDRAEFTDARIAGIPVNSAWTFEYYLAGNRGSTPDATQYALTRTRALTIDESRVQGMADLTAAQRQAFRDATVAANGASPIGGLTALNVSYRVPSDALPPYLVTLFGRNAGKVWNDEQSVTSFARDVSIRCSGGAEDSHCSAGTNAFVAGAEMVSLTLAARDPYGRIFGSYYGFFLR